MPDTENRAKPARAESLPVQVVRLGVLYSLFALALGVCLLVWREEAVAIAYIAVSAAVVLYGLWKACRYFFETPAAARERQLLSTGLLLLTVGFLLLIFRLDEEPNWLTRIMAALMLFGAAIRFQAAFDLKRMFYKRWYVFAVLALVEAVLGVLALIPVFEKQALILVLGGLLAAEGLADGWCRLAMRRIMRAREKAAKKAAEAAERAAAEPKPEVQPEPGPAEAKPETPAETEPEAPTERRHKPVFGHTKAEDPFKTDKKPSMTEEKPEEPKEAKEEEKEEKADGAVSLKKE